MSKRSVTNCDKNAAKLRRSIDDNSPHHSNAKGAGKRPLCNTDSDNETIPQKKPNTFCDMRNDYQASGVKRALHGTIYQLKLLILFIVRGLKNNYNFRLATEIDAADKFDDLVFQYQRGNVIANRFLQAKHKQDESKKISFSDLNNERNDDFSLQKYFMSYQRIKTSLEFEGELSDFILCTNIDLDYEDLQRNNLKVDIISERDDFLLSHGKSSKCSFTLDSKNELYEKMRECSKIYTLAKALASHIVEGKILTLKSEIFQLYHTALVKEHVIDKDQGTFHQKFINSDASLSESAMKLRKIVEKHFSNNGLTIANAKSFKFSKSFCIGFVLNRDPQIKNVREFALELANLIKNAKIGEAVMIRRNKDIIKDNIDKLSGNVIVKKDDKLLLSKKFLEISSTLCGNLDSFRTELKNDLQKDNFDFNSLKELTLNVSNFETCEEEQIYCEATLPTDKIEDDEINEFFKKLIFAVNQPNELELTSIIEREMGEYSDFNLLDAYLVTDSLQIQILNWFKMKCGTWITNENATTFLDSIKQKMYSLISVGYNSYIETLKAFDIRYRNENEILNAFLIADSSSDTGILNFFSTEDTLFGALKVFQTIRAMPKYRKQDSFLFMCLTTFLLPEIQKRVLTAFGPWTSNDLLVIECNTKIDFKIDRLVIDQLSTAINQNKRIILISQRNHTEYPFHPFALEFTSRRDVCYESSSFTNLSQESQMKILEKCICFQGDKVKLKTILPDENFWDVIDSNTLIKLIRNEEVTIGGKLQILNDYNKFYYVNRNFYSAKHVQKVSDKSNVPDHVKDEYSIQRPLPQVFLGSYWGTYAKNVFLNEDHFVKHQYEVASGNLVLLSEDSGNGKSTILYRLFELIKDSFPFHSIFSLCLNNYTKILKAELINFQMSNELSVDSAIDLLLKMLQSVNAYTQFEIDFIRNSFKHHNKITIFFDGFDEVCPDYEKLIIRLVSELRKTKIAKIWLTTRSSLKDILEKTFKVSAVSLQPFNVQDQIEFLTKFWYYTFDSENINLKRIETYAEALITKFLISIRDAERKFTGSPMQLKMLASVFQHSFSDKWQGCMELLTNTDIVPIFPKKLKLNDVYKTFITLKCNVYSDEKGTKRIGNIASNNESLFYIKTALRSHEELAFQELFDDDKIDWLNVQSDDEFLESIEKIGIVQKINENFRFVHKTFAEYLVAKNLASSLEKKRLPKAAIEFLFEEILLQTHNEGIRTFFDGFLSKMLLSENVLRECGRILVRVLDSTNSPYLSNYPLHLACTEDNFAIIYFIANSLIEHTESLKSLIEAKNEVGETMLFKAVDTNDLNLIKFLKTTTQANVEATDRFGRTVLMKSVIYSVSLEVIQILGGNVNAIDDENESVLFRAVEKGNLEVVNFLLSQGARVDFVADNGITVLHNAIHSGCLDVVQCLVKHGANVDASDDDGVSVLHYACYSGNLGICQWLVDKSGGVNIHSKSADGSSILHEAAISGNLILCQWLVRLGLSHTCKDHNDRTVLHEACKYNNFAVANWLVQLPDVDILSVDSNGNTLLIEAAKYGDSKLCEWLIGLGLSTDVTDNRGRTLLYIAIEYGNLDVLRWLTSEHSNYNAAEQEIRCMQGEDLLLPILFSSADHEMKWMLEKNSTVNKSIGSDGILRIRNIIHKNDDEEIILHLVESGANINAQDNIGQTIFHCAIPKGKIGLVKRLLKLNGEKADIALRDKHGRTALDVAKEAEEFNLVQVLEKLQIN